MKLFEVGENVVEGWEVTADVKKRRLYLQLGRNKQNYAARTHFRFGQSLNQLMFPSNLPPREEDFEDLILTHGNVAKDNRGYCLVRQSREDRRALLRVGLACGVGGSIKYIFGKGCLVVAEGVLIGVDDEEMPMYVVQMNEGSSFEVHRDGDLDGLPPRMLFTWDGETLAQSVV